VLLLLLLLLLVLCCYDAPCATATATTPRLLLLLLLLPLLRLIAATTPTTPATTTTPTSLTTTPPLPRRYVDEVSCIGCTNCANLARSTFFMEEDYGRARVFRQDGDDDETVLTAIETCPVDCIHFVPWDELKALERDREGQTINFMSRLVNQGEGAGTSLSTGIGVGFRGGSAQQMISGNQGMRCTNCPSRGCEKCPMYGVGKNPTFVAAQAAKAEKKRATQERRAKRLGLKGMFSSPEAAELFEAEEGAGLDAIDIIAAAGEWGVEADVEDAGDGAAADDAAASAAAIAAAIAGPEVGDE